MTNSKTTRKALLSSVLALTLCVAMLIATTFAWFTDTASTAVNKIQSGTLDVDLEMATEWNDDDSVKTWESADGKTLEFQKAEGSNDQAVLWEPGCTYELPQLRVVNNGSLKLKYKIAITGIQGDAKLNEAIEWTIKAKNVETTATELASQEYTLEAKDGETVYSDPLTIKGHMRENAGNEYQGLSIDGISITVYATQVEGEYDSNGNDYDGGATYNYRSATIVDEDNGKTTTLEAGKTYSVGVANVTVDANGDITYKNDTDTAQTVTITTDRESLTIDAPKDTVYHYGTSGEVKIIKVADNSYHEFGEVEYLAVTSGRVVIKKGDNVKTLQVHKADSSTESDKAAPAATIAVPQGVKLDTELQIESDAEVKVAVIDEKGKEISGESFSIKQTGTKVDTEIPKELIEILKKGGEMTFAEPEDKAAKIDNIKYNTLHEAILAAKEGQTVTLLKNSSGSGLETGDSGDSHGSFTIDFNGYTYTVEGDTVGSSGTANQAMHWGKSANAIDIKDGRIIVQDSNDLKMIMQNYVALTMKNMVIDGEALDVEKSVYGENYKEKYPDYYGKQRPMFNNNGSSTMTLTDCTISLPSGSTYGVSASEGNVVLKNTRVNGSASIEQLGKTISVDETSKITKGVVSYFDKYIAVNDRGTYSLANAGAGSEAELKAAIANAKKDNIIK